MRRAKDLAGQVVVVTGAARGIGALTARRLAARNARVALLGLEPGELARVSACCGPCSRWWEIDVTDERALTDVAAAVRDAYDRIDVVIANAGIAIGGPFIRCDARTFARVIEVNLLGSVATASAFLPALLKSRGYLLQVASLAALTPAPMMTAYSASKSGVEAFAHALRAEVASLSAWSY
jgi:NAD(P)-dependent dehydrogenase (short-subunit alcohol dehydrogenase family)